jgi:acyl carrier protein
MWENSTKELIGIIENALDVEENSLTIDSTSDDLEEWDSLGHLGILVTLDECFHGKIAGIEEMATASSVKKILQILNDHSLV